MKLKSDKYKKSRGGSSRLLDIFCTKCGQHLCFYQKDGLGSLKRLYLDRIYGSGEYSRLENQPLKSISQLTCSQCKTLIGMPYIYEKENRLAFRLIAGRFLKKITKSN